MKDKTFLFAAAFIAGVTLTHLFENRAHKKAIAVLENNHRDSENRTFRTTFDNAWEEGRSHGYRTAKLEAITSKTESEN